jgi:hypothetical protein
LERRSWTVFVLRCELLPIVSTRHCLTACRYSVAAPVPERTLPELLAKVLLAFALDFERRSEVSLAIAANLLRVLDEAGVRVRDLPARSGVSKEGLQMAMGIAGKRKLAVVEPDPAAGPFKVARLTKKGAASKDACRALLAAVEKHWLAEFGADDVNALRRPLEEIVGDSTPERSPLFKGLEPYPHGWRAKVRRPHTLPHFPMVLHRGGFPDGS